MYQGLCSVLGIFPESDVGPASVSSGTDTGQAEFLKCSKEGADWSRLELGSWGWSGPVNQNAIPKKGTKKDFSSEYFILRAEPTPRKAWVPNLEGPQLLSPVHAQCIDGNMRLREVCLEKEWDSGEMKCLFWASSNLKSSHHRLLRHCFLGCGFDYFANQIWAPGHRTVESLSSLDIIHWSIVIHCYNQMWGKVPRIRRY